MTIRRARESDLPGLVKLLCQVLTVHHEGRPDLFKPHAQKYTEDELLALLRDDSRPIFACVDEWENLRGYAFCVFIRHTDDNILTNIKTLYIDDLCVDEACRGQHVGSALYHHVCKFAKQSGCYNVTLNVWACNKNALAFYEKCGLVPQKIGMEQILLDT